MVVGIKVNKVKRQDFDEIEGATKSHFDIDSGGKGHTRFGNGQTDKRTVLARPHVVCSPSPTYRQL